ncbi:hypothetical protein M5D96_003618, partial [Drosophila gunungcola]
MVYHLLNAAAFCYRFQLIWPKTAAVLLPCFLFGSSPSIES